MKENKKLGFYSALASFFGILAFIFTFLPAYFEEGKPDISFMEMIVGNDRVEANGLMLFALILLILGTLVSICLTVLNFINKSNDKIQTILGIVSGILILVGGIILALGIIITGLNKANSELGLIQGNWGPAIGNYLEPISALLAFAMCYPNALIILHHKDLEDQAK